MNRVRTTRMGLMVVAGLLLAGCAGQPADDSAWAEVRDAYEQAAQDPQIQARAPTPLFEAEQALERAAESDDAAQREHLLYLASQHIDIARTVAERAGLERQIKTLASERERLQLAAREQELQQLRSELAALEARRTDRGLLVTLDEVFFETGKANIATGTESTLDKLATFMRDHPDQEVVIEGHTDSRGPEEYNRDLSQRRAEAVKQAMVARGVQSDRLVTRGYGESRPVASNENAGGRQLNRRVEIVFPNGGT